MDALTMTRLCAEMMGHEWRIVDDYVEIRIDDPDEPFCDIAIRYAPMEEDAQCMALVKKFGLLIDFDSWGPPEKVWSVRPSKKASGRVVAHDLNHAIVECCAKLQASKNK